MNFSVSDTGILRERKSYQLVHYCRLKFNNFIKYNVPYYRKLTLMLITVRYLKLMQLLLMQIEG